jgi:hypothetical protein
MRAYNMVYCTKCSSFSLILSTSAPNNIITCVNHAIPERNLVSCAIIQVYLISDNFIHPDLTLQFLVSLQNPLVDVVLE